MEFIFTICHLLGMKISYVQFEPGNQELKEEEELDIESQLTTLQV